MNLETLDFTSGPTWARTRDHLIMRRVEYTYKYQNISEYQAVTIFNFIYFNMFLYILLLFLCKFCANYL